MIKKLAFYSMLIAVISLMTQCTGNNTKKNSGLSSNSLLQKWEGPYNGVPPFDKVKADEFKPALEAAMGENREEIAKLVDNKETPSFQNTIEGLEKTGTTLKRVIALYGIWKSNLSTPQMDSIQEEMEPRLAAFSDSIIQNTALFKKIETVYNDSAKKNLNPEQQRLLERYYKSFVLAGAKLDADSKAKVADINKKLAGLFTTFSKHQLADEGDKFLEITNEKDLDGLPDDFKAAAKDAAAAKGKKDSWAISNTRSSVAPFITYCNNRDMREKAWRMFINRGDNGDANDNNATITEILQLRAQRALLLGYPTHAHWRLADKMAKTPENAMALLESVWTPAVLKVKEEVSDMQKLADKEGAKIKIEAWDYRYYAEKVRKEKYDINQEEVKQYMQLEKLREGMFYVAGELFNMQFTQVSDAPVYHPDIRVFKVTDKTSGELIGMWYFDPYARKGKRSGAWMNAYRDQEKLNGNITTIVSNNCNFIKGKDGEPVLISFDDATTLFHEFGHALHGLSSRVTYPTLSGTNVATDYVEFPSQLLQRWLTTPEVLNKFALHYKTGEPLPQALIDKIHNSSKFNKGFETVEAVASALVDMKIHLAGNVKINPDSFERATLESIGMPSEIVMRHRLPQFGHIFSDDGYSAGYYSYLWSDVLSADAYSAFTEAGGPYDKAVAKRLVDHVFSVGGTVDEAEGYKAFRGREPNSDALMKSRGFPIPVKK
ncbi:MAG: M3 family metallopeptidase [Bacteroidetes bacterium]|nr:M3 family metallopeptidase [Bacteroidota bacterium]